MAIPAKQRPVIHHTFRVERTYPAAPARVFAAFANQQLKRRWFAEGEGWEVEQFTLDFRVGGRETTRFRFQGGTLMGNDTLYLDIVPDQRIVFAYTMTAGETRTSVSLATVELSLAGGRTHLVYTEQGAYFDGADAPALREVGCRDLLTHLAIQLNSRS